MAGHSDESIDSAPVSSEQATARAIPERAQAVCQTTPWPSPLQDWRLVGGLVFSLFVHAAAIAGMTVVRVGVDRPPILVDLVPLAPAGAAPAPGQAAKPPAAPVRSPRSSPASVATPKPVPVGPAAPVSESRPEPPAPTAERRDEPAPLPPAPRTEWPSVQVPQFRGAGLAASAAVGASSSTEEAPGTSIVQGSRVRPSAGPNAGPAGRAWGGTPGTPAGQGSFAAPRFERQRKPRYPEAARRGGIEGTAIVKAHVLNDGSVGVAEIRRSSGYSDLDRAALEAIRESRFIPAERSGRPVAVWIEIPVQFTLKQ